MKYFKKEKKTNKQLQKLIKKHNPDYWNDEKLRKACAVAALNQKDYNENNK